MVTIGVLLHTVMLAGTVTVGLGFTVMVYDADGPVHPVCIGVTVMVAVIGALVLLIAVNAFISFVPFPGIPIVVLEFIHVYDEPGYVLVKFVAGTVFPAQTIILAGTITFGV